MGASKLCSSVESSRLSGRSSPGAQAVLLGWGGLWAHMDERQHLLQQGFQQLGVAAREAGHLHLVEGRQEGAPERLCRPLCCRGGQQSFQQLALQDHV